MDLKQLVEKQQNIKNDLQLLDHKNIKTVTIQLTKGANRYNLDQSIGPIAEIALISHNFVKNIYNITNNNNKFCYKYNNNCC